MVGRFGTIFKITSTFQKPFKFEYYDMKEAKGVPDMVEALGSIQQLILKPEWKELVQDVMKNEMVTRKTHEAVLAVANAIVTPLSLLIHAAKLPADQIQECQTLWKEALKQIGAKCSPKEQQTKNPSPEKNTPGDEFDAEESNSAKRRLSFEYLGHESQEETNLNDGFVGPEHDMGPDEDKASVGVPKEGNDESSDPETEKESAPVPPEIDQLDKASKSETGGKRCNKILASFAARKGLVTNKTFHQRNRQVISRMNDFEVRITVCFRDKANKRPQMTIHQLMDLKPMANMMTRLELM